MSNGPAGRIFSPRAEAAVADTQLRRKLENATGRHLDHVAATRAEFPAYEDERDASRRIKEDSIARLDDLLGPAQGAPRGQRMQRVRRRRRGRGAQVYRRPRARARRTPRGQGQVDDDRGNRAQPGARGGRMRGGRDRPRRVYRATARRASLAHHHARDPSLQGRHRPSVRREAARPLHLGAHGAHRARPRAPARGLSRRRDGRNRRQLRDRRNRHPGAGRERRQRADVEHAARKFWWP